MLKKILLYSCPIYLPVLMWVIMEIEVPFLAKYGGDWRYIVGYLSLSVWCAILVAIYLAIIKLHDKEDSYKDKYQ